MLETENKLKPNKALLSNFTSLFVLQVSNYLLPLIILPYLVRILGAEKFGLVSFAFAFAAYFVTFCNYGFNYSGTKFISVNRDDNENLSTAFSSIILVKLLLFVFSLTLLVLIIFTFNRFKQEWLLFIFSSGFVLGEVLFPVWFFQGIEKMKYISIIQLTAKICFTLSVFLFIREENDYVLYAGLFSVSNILAGLTGLLIVLFKFKIIFVNPGFVEIKFHLKEGLNIFLSMISINIYTISNTFILGLFAPDTVVGYFAAADKIRIASQGIISVISQTFFPYINNLLKNSLTQFYKSIRKILVLQSVTGLILSSILFLFSDLLVDMILGTGFQSSVVILKILSPLPFLIALSNSFGILTMLPLGFDRQFNTIISIAALIHVMVLIFLIPLLAAVGTSISMVVTETIVTAAVFIFIVKKTKLLRNKNV